MKKKKKLKIHRPRQSAALGWCAYSSAIITAPSRRPCLKVKRFSTRVNRTRTFPDIRIVFLFKISNDLRIQTDTHIYILYWLADQKWKNVVRCSGTYRNPLLNGSIL